MKKIVIPITIMVLLNAATISCQKECTSNAMTETVNIDTTKKVWYTVGGISGSRIFSNEDEYDEFLLQLIRMAQNEIIVEVYTGDSLQHESLAKEVVTFTTSSSTEAMNWAKKKLNEGYKVAITYDEEKSLYTCTASR